MPYRPGIVVQAPPVILFVALTVKHIEAFWSLNMKACLLTPFWSVPSQRRTASSSATAAAEMGERKCEGGTAICPAENCCLVWVGGWVGFFSLMGGVGLLGRLAGMDAAEECAILCVNGADCFSGIENCECTDAEDGE